MTKILGRHQKQIYVYFRALPPHPLHGKNPLCWLPFVFVWFCDTVGKLKLRHWWNILTSRDGQWRALAIFLEICFFGNPLEYCIYQWKRFCHIILSQKDLKCRILLGSLLIERQSSFWLSILKLLRQLCETSPSPNWNSECRLSPLSLKGWWWIFYNSLFLRAGEEKVKDRHIIYSSGFQLF